MRARPSRRADDGSHRFRTCDARDLRHGARRRPIADSPAVIPSALRARRRVRAVALGSRWAARGDTGNHAGRPPGRRVDPAQPLAAALRHRVATPTGQAGRSERRSRHRSRPLLPRLRPLASWPPRRLRRRSPLPRANPPPPKRARERKRARTTSKNKGKPTEVSQPPGATTTPVPASEPSATEAEKDHGNGNGNGNGNDKDKDKGKGGDKGHNG